jgi:tripartite ATP-independent transporter DctM subunit
MQPAPLQPDAAAQPPPSGLAAGAAALADGCEAIVLAAGRLAAALFVPLTVAIVVHVVLRYACGVNLVWLEELHWQLYAFLATLGLASCLATDSHVRLDILQAGWSPRTRARVDAVGLLTLVLPLAALLSWHGFASVAQSFAIGERSVNEQGLPFTFIAKAALPTGFMLVALAAMARLIRSALLLAEPRPAPVGEPAGRGSRIVMAVGIALSLAAAMLAWQAGRVAPSYALAVGLFASFLALLFTGFPIAFVLGGVAVIFIAVGYATDWLGYTLTADHPGTRFYLGTAAAFVNRIYGGLLNKPELVALPMFIFMGLLLDRSGLAARMLDAMQRLFGRVRGGLAISVVAIGMLLAASTGIIGASVVLLGLLALPMMLRQGYAPPLAAGTVCSAGTLGILMPPSIMLVIMADQASIPVGDLFMGAVLPSLVLSGLYVLLLVAIGWLAPAAAPLAKAAEPLSWRAFGHLAAAVIPALGLIVLVLGSIFAGLATVTEASGIGVLGAGCLACWHWLRMPADGSRPGHRGLAAELWQTCLAALRITGSIVGILIGATCFAFILRELGGDSMIRLGLESLPLSPYGLVAVILAVVFVLGFFLDWIEITIIVLPLVVGVVSRLELGLVSPLGFDRPADFEAARAAANTLWFCVAMAVCLQTSFLTPPVGFALFYLKGVAPPEIRLADIYRGIVPFVLVQLAGLLLVVWFGRPLVLWLPALVYGR